ncbi:unnamed protein product, partial [Ectocarpus sp. 12 AP-2014]
SLSCTKCVCEQGTGRERSSETRGACLCTLLWPRARTQTPSTLCRNSARHWTVATKILGAPKTLFPSTTDGFKVDGEYAVHASTSFGTTWAIWVLSQYQDYVLGGTLEIRCKDSDENDASLIHPTEVIQWDCEEADNEFTRLDYVTTTCGCTTLSGGSTDDGWSTGEIAGVVVGAIVIILGILAAYFGKEYVCKITGPCDNHC